MTDEQKQRLEKMGEELVGIAESLPAWKNHSKNKPLEAEFYDVKDLLQTAWTLKQIARRGEIKRDLVSQTVI